MNVYVYYLLKTLCRPLAIQSVVNLDSDRYRISGVSPLLLNNLEEFGKLERRGRKASRRCAGGQSDSGPGHY